ncbi:MAG: NlpC/P60 family protein, partial [Nitrospiraceae bacterium]|nr:NlpC/P60 family protein [Nitrospiraceae bacterium]
REAMLSAASRQRLVVYKDRYHKARKGETLFSIARQYGTTIKKLRELNGLRSRRARLRSGRRLLISQKDAVMREAPGTYRVKRGDTFLKIAREFHRDAEELMALNEMDSEDLRPGQTIMLTDKDESPAVQADARVSAPQIESKLEELQDSKTLQTLSMKDRLMLFAKVMLNIPYRFGGDNFYGIDCSAFVQRVFKLLNISLPRTARQQFNEGVPVSLDDLAIGDLVFFRTYASFPSHVGIYIGKNLFIHASSGGHRVKIGSLTTPYFMKRLIGAKRLLSGGELPITGSGK